jgi:Fe-S-cluster containining protein
MAELNTNQMVENSPRMGLDTQFQFQCGPERECFNRCCADVAILLSPYDVLRLKKAMRMDSSAFLEKYTLTMRSRDSKLPVVFLRMDEESRKCPFVGESGCTVYRHRPWACRMYPLGMAEPAGQNASAGRFYFLVKESLCQGHQNGSERSVRDWIDNQELEAFDLMQAPFLELMAHPQWQSPEALSQEKLDMYFMSIYDLDRFRRFVFDTRFLEFFDIDESRVQAIAQDDEELLEFAFDWLAFSLFREKRMKIKKPAPSVPQNFAEAQANSSACG